MRTEPCGSRRKSCFWQTYHNFGHCVASGRGGAKSPTIASSAPLERQWALAWTFGVPLIGFEPQTNPWSPPITYICPMLRPDCGSNGWNTRREGGFGEGNSHTRDGWQRMFLSVCGVCGVMAGPIWQLPWQLSTKVFGLAVSRGGGATRTLENRDKNAKKC